MLTLTSRVRVALMLGALLTAPAHRARAQAEILTNESIVQMLTGKLSKDLILLKIKSSTPGYDLSADGLVFLQSKKVSQELMKAMMTAADDAQRAGGRRSSEVLSNDAVVKMVAGQVPKSIIMAKLQNTRTAFDVSTGGLVRLNESKVPQDIIKVMMSPPPPPPGSAAAAPPPPAPTSKPDVKAETKPDTKGDAKKADTRKADPKKTDPKTTTPVKKPPTTT